MKRLAFFIPSAIAFVILAGACQNITQTGEIVDVVYQDSAIMEAVDRELQVNEGVPCEEIEIGVEDGVVTLSGCTENILAREKAREIALSIKGVEAVVNEIRVEPGDHDDKDILNNIRKALSYDPVTMDKDIQVSVENGKVTLKGLVDSWQEVQAASEVAKSVKGVKEVTNFINFRYQYHADRSDEEIALEVKRALRSDVRIDDELITVKVDDHEVKLQGEVGSGVEKELAEQDAWVVGVHSVNSDDLDVKLWSREPEMRATKYVPKSNEETEEAIRKAFEHDSRVEYFDLQVEVDDGVATLKGMVDNLNAKRAAEEDARNVVSIRNVNNNIRIMPDSIPEDEVLEQQIINVFNWDPYLEDEDIRAEVEDGTVSLYGNVENYFERSRAGEVVSHLKGTVEINNYIDVEAFLSGYGYYPFPGVHDWSTPRYEQRKPDQKIRKEVKEQIKWSVYLNPEEVDVEVSRGIAILSGTVETHREKMMAERKAFQAGARDVINNIEVRYDSHE